MSLRATALSVLPALGIFAGLAMGDIQLTGVIRDEITNLPVEDAIVTHQATTNHTTTDANGVYSITVADATSVILVAAKKGYFNQSGTYFVGDPLALDINIPMVPHADDPNYEFMSPNACAVCHHKQFDEWTDSPMAKAGLNTWVHDIYNGTGTDGGMGGFVYTRDSMFAGSNPNSECASCHQPEPWIQTPFSRMESPNDPGYPSLGVVHGISCDTCHKIADVDVTKINFPGIFPGAVEFTRPEGPEFNQVMYGTLGDVDFSLPTVMRASYNPQLVAETCAVCHQDAADPDENHTYNGVISEPTYLEWTASAYSDPNSPHYANCVDCHMPATKDTQVSSLFDLGRPAGSARNHMILGTTPEFLENAAELFVNTTTAGNQLTIDIDVANLYTGHHLPTGVTVRNMILLVEAWDQNTGEALVFTGDQIIHDLGGVGDPAQGYYAGLPGVYFGKVNHDINGNGPTFFTDATGITFDNRIPALQTDSSSYSFTLPDNGSVQVSTRLIYRRAFRALVDAKQWTTDGHGNPLADIAAPHFGHLMESSDINLNICTADLTNDGEVDFLDISAFITDYVAHNALGDFNGDGEFDLPDISAFIGAFTAGCP
ncbi:MAG: hypothetical protein JKY43_05805 [Phycisphaerales bacterium]|nr:hypothetical protein [Phycisphaerales bacterium]